jgi:DNA-binding transcriptional regulator LsrR (DeoR family)
MSQERLSMRKITEVLRLKWTCDLSNQAIARSCRISHSTVSEYLARAEQAGLSWVGIFEN